MVTMRVLSATLMIAVSPAALAQETGDWDIHRDPDRPVVLAYTAFNSGLTLAARCDDGSFNVIVRGLPETTDERRNLRVSFRGEAPYQSGWTTATDQTAALADFPAQLAREFRLGGEFRLTVPAGAPDGRDLTHAVELPLSNAAIEEVLTACQRPLVDPRDAQLEAVTESGLPTLFTWRRIPAAQYPQTFASSGFAVVSCITQPDGRLRDCEVEMEFPTGEGFGAAALRGAQRARVAHAGSDQSVPTLRIGFRVMFRVQ